MVLLLSSHFFKQRSYIHFYGWVERGAHIQAFCLLRLPPLLLQTETSPIPSHYSTFSYPQMITIILKLLSGASSYIFTKQVSFSSLQSHSVLSTDSSFISLFILCWKGDYSPYPMGIMYYNHIIVSLEDFNITNRVIYSANLSVSRRHNS